MAKSKLVKNTFTLWGWSSFAGLASALFYILMARFLSVESYSLLYSLIAFSYILTIPQETIRTVLSRFSTKFLGKGQKGKIHFLFSKFLKQMLLIGVIVFVIFLLLIPYLKTLFKTTSLPLMLIGIALIFAFILPIVWGILQGTFRFKQLGINNSAEMFFKLGIAVLLVLLLPGPWKVIGAIAAIPASILLSFLVGLIPIKDILKTKPVKVPGEKVSKYVVASLALFSLIAALHSIDVILARYFFTETVSGWYAGLSMIAKSLFFIAMNAKRVMLPSIVKEEKNQKKSRKLLGKTALMICGLFALFLVISIFFPKVWISVFLGSKYLDVAPILKYIILAFSFFSLSTLMVFYNLSINKNKKISIRILASAVFMQVALLLIFHSTLMQYITMILIVNIFMFVTLLIVSLRKQ
ncbi:MAG: hypothetical protein JSW08_03760 [archaeon]|nr:MAG: hypothetical protein JSW08_03760 [archaeon]